MDDPVMPLFADAGPGPLIVPILGGLGVAGAFLAAAIVAGGFWALRGSEAPRARKFFLVTTAALCLGAALVFGMLGETQSEFLLAAAVLAVMGVGLLIVLRSVAPAREEIADSTE
jgi:O-antigen/teichoic acid export membrane protein